MHAWFAMENRHARAKVRKSLGERTLRRDIENQSPFSGNESREFFRHRSGPEFDFHWQLSDAIAEWKHESGSMRKLKKARPELGSKSYQKNNGTWRLHQKHTQVFPS